MKVLTKEMFNICEKQLYNRARDLEVAIYNALFTTMPKEMVLDALSLYQNRDGGFGSGLEIDNLNPNSSPAVVNEVLQIIKMVGFKNAKEDDLLEFILKRAFNYLYNRVELVDNKWPFAIESNNEYPCASWWKYDNQKVTYNPTASILGYTIYFLDNDSPYYKKACDMLDKCLDYYLENEINSKHEIMCYLVLRDCLEEKGIVHPKTELLSEKLLDDSYRIVAKTKEEFAGIYPTMPLDLFYKVSEDPQINKLIDENLDYLIESIRPHGLWEANFRWGNEYPEQESALLKWMGRISVNNLYLLKKFKRIELE